MDLLEWDMQVSMPVKGNGGRALQIAYLTDKLTELWQYKKLKSLFSNEVPENFSP